jgi:hypothetical protein
VLSTLSYCSWFFFRKVFLGRKKNDKKSKLYAIKVMKKADMVDKNMVDQGTSFWVVPKIAGVPTFFNHFLFEKCIVYISWSKSILFLFIFHNFMVKINTFLGRVVFFLSEWWSGRASADRQGQNTAHCIFQTGPVLCFEKV